VRAPDKPSIIIYVILSHNDLYEKPGVRIQNTEEKQYHGYSGS